MQQKFVLYISNRIDNMSRRLEYWTCIWLTGFRAKVTKNTNCQCTSKVGHSVLRKVADLVFNIWSDQDQVWASRIKILLKSNLLYLITKVIYGDDVSILWTCMSKKSKRWILLYQNQAGSRSGCFWEGRIRIGCFSWWSDPDLVLFSRVGSGFAPLGSTTLVPLSA